jgi:nifR3 family TIM-barrel protein
MLVLGSLKLKNWLIMAPMSGRTNLPFRLIVKKMGAGLVTTEMVSAVGLSRGQGKTRTYLASQPYERPVAAQIFGSDPDAMAVSAGIVEEAGMALVDINMGCPVKKVVKTGSGAALMRDEKKVSEIISAVRKKTNLPVTAKIRAGWSPEEANALKIARIIEDCGADGISIHPRFAKQGFSGKADWSLIGRIKEALRIPVMGNGDVTEPSLALQMRRSTGCDGVMIGRAALTNPWIFRQVLDMEEKGSFVDPGLEEKHHLIIEHFTLLVEHLGEKWATNLMRGLVLLYTKKLPKKRFLKERIPAIKGKEALIALLNDYFAHLKEETSREG